MRTDAKWLIWSVRIAAYVLAAALLFSGFAKAVDPQGMCIKLNAYFAHFGFHFSDDALGIRLSVGLLTLTECLLGLYLLLGIRRKFTTVATAVLMGVFTALTIYIYIANPVPDCGCFGEALTLTHGQTLAKNIVLLGCALLVAFFPQHLARLISQRNQWLTSIWTLVYVVGLIIFTFHYLPLLDLTDYKKGASIRAALTDPESPESHTDLANFYVATPDGTMMFDSIANASGETFLLTLPEADHADDGCNDILNDLYDYCQDRGIGFYAVFVEEQADQIDAWNDRTGAVYPALVGESTAVKAMVRANPGLMLLRDGKIIQKWSNNNLPSNFDDAAGSQIDAPLKAPLRLLLWYVVPLLIILAADGIWVASKLRRRWKIKREIEKNSKIN